MLNWIESHQGKIRPTTEALYRITIKNQINPYLGKIPIRDLRLARIEGLYSYLLENGIGERTVQLVHAILNRALKQAVRYEYILKNPAQGANVPRVERKEMQVLDENAAFQFLLAAQDSPHSALYNLAIRTGMRQGELFGLQWKDIDWKEGKVQIQRQITRIPYKGWSFSIPKTKSSVRPIQLGNSMLDVLRDQKQIVNTLIRDAGDAWKDYDLVFPTSVGTPYNPSNLRKDFNRVLDKAGLPRVRFRDLRHSAASIMLKNNIPLLVVSDVPPLFTTSFNYSIDYLFQLCYY